MYPKCGCPTECRLCGALAKRSKDKKAKPVSVVIGFKPGITKEAVTEFIKALGKDVVHVAEASEYEPGESNPPAGAAKP